eukprot:gene7866-8716_t
MFARETKSLGLSCLVLIVFIGAFHDLLSVVEGKHLKKEKQYSNTKSYKNHHKEETSSQTGETGEKRQQQQQQYDDNATDNDDGAMSTEDEQTDNNSTDTAGQTNAQTDAQTGANTNADTSANTASATSSESSSESASVMNSKTHTRIAAKSNARTKAAANVKIQANAKSDTKVNAGVKGPTQPTVPTAPTTPTAATTPTTQPPPTTTPKPLRITKEAKKNHLEQITFLASFDNGRITAELRPYLKAPSFPGHKKTSNQEPTHFKHAAVSSDHHLCSEIGKRILQKGGSAVDSIISVQFCVEVVNSHSTGIGGGGFMLVYDKKSGKASAFDFRETLPLGFRDNANKTQGETVLVPGVLRGLEHAHKKFGKLPWDVLLAPAIEVCERGFKIHEALGHAIEKKDTYIMDNPGLKSLYAPNGKLLKTGDILKRPVLAKTFKKIAEKGADEFYKGKMAAQIVKDIQEAGGFMTLTDLSGYRAIEKGPLRTKVNGLEMLSTPPPGSGALISLALKIMSGFNWTRDDITKPERLALTYHRIVESLKFAYAPFTYLGDPKFTNHTEEVIKYMLDDKIAENMRARIDNVSHTVNYYGPHSTAKPEDKRGTSHMSVLGPHGDAASLTSTINAYFGSKLRSQELGIIFNNELADFSEFWPSVYNLERDRKIPGKRPMSKSSPIIFLDNKKNSIANWLFFRDNIKQAITRPRLHCQLFPPTVVYEPNFPPDLIPQLQKFSHAYVTNSTYDVSGQLNAIMGVVQAIVKEENGKISAEADIRKGGKPSGY